jgi:hypothetical protein
MNELKTLRQGWAEKEAEEAKLSSDLTIQERAKQFFALYQTFSTQLEETQALFGPERRVHLAKLQQRLQQLAKWQEQHARHVIPERSSTTKSLK